VSNEETMIKVLGEKIQKIIDNNNLNEAELILIGNVGKLSRVL
tara:strand:+ start:87 stop:215 length:129 start_codon:yes stop_codon:yes gene_type:complete